MENQNHSPKTDIAEQAYKGTGVTVSAIGYSWVDFKLSALASGAVGLAMSWLAPEGTKTALNELESRFTRWGKAESSLYKAAGKTGSKFLEMGRWFEGKVPGKDWLKARVGEAKWGPVSRLTGMLTVVGFGASFITGFFHAKSSVSGGKQQFAEAQTEIITLRKQLAEAKQAEGKTEQPVTPPETSAETTTTAKMIQQPSADQTPLTTVHATAAEHEALEQSEKHSSQSR